MDPATNALALWGDVDDPITGGFPAYAAQVVEDYLDEVYYPDGVPGEGITYGGCLCYVMNFAHMLNRKGIAHGILDPRPAMKRIALYYYLSRDPGDVAFSLGKCEPLEMRAYNMWLQIARFFDVPLARWWWRRRFDAMCESPDMAPLAASTTSGKSPRVPSASHELRGSRWNRRKSACLSGNPSLARSPAHLWNADQLYCAFAPRRSFLFRIVEQMACLMEF